MGAAAIMGKVVEARKDASDLPCFETGRERIGRIGAGIDGRLAVKSDEASVPIRIGGDAIAVLAAVRASEILSTILDPAQGTAKLAGGPPKGDFLGEQDALVAKSAADIRGDDADPPLVETETFGEPGADDMRLLGRADNDELFGASVPIGDDPASFQGTHDLARRL